MMHFRSLSSLRRAVRGATRWIWTPTPTPKTASPVVIKGTDTRNYCDYVVIQVWSIREVLLRTLRGVGQVEICGGDVAVRRGVKIF